MPLTYPTFSSRDIPTDFRQLRIPVMAAPMFIVSTPVLVIAQCTSGILGSFPALSARSTQQLDEWLQQINEALARWDREHPYIPAAPYAVNLIVHASNKRLDEDLQTCGRHGVRVYITSLGSQDAVNKEMHAHGAFIFHDVINQRFARKAIENGADGLVAVAAGAGGHAGTKSPFALMQELRAFFDGPLALAGSIANGRSILAAQCLGADLAYIGSPFIATPEARASAAYQTAIVDGSSDDIVYSDSFTGVHGNYLRSSIEAAGLDPERLPAPSRTGKELGSDLKKAWKDIWGCGQGIGAIQAIVPTATLIDRLEQEYAQALTEIRIAQP